MFREFPQSLSAAANPSKEQQQATAGVPTAAPPLPPPLVRFRTEFNKSALQFAFDVRGWADVDETGQGPWNFCWASVFTVRALFAADSQVRLNDFQIINHFPNHYELTRKDLMYKNLRRYFKEMSSNAKQHLEILNARRSMSIWDCVPITFSIPNDLALFTAEFKRCPAGTVWIVKPANRSQGKGIFLVSKLSQLHRWLKDCAEEGAASGGSGGTTNATAGGGGGGGGPQPMGALRDPHIISRYVHRPFLIGGRKFDLRLYVLVTCYRPLRAYLHREGFARFCATKYELGAIDAEDLSSHLTNVALQKHEDEYNPNHGGKWSFENLIFHVESTRGAEVAGNLIDDIDFVIVQSLRAVQNVMNNDRHCFELYGYDLLVDEDLRPHLIEVNASPSLTSTTRNDLLLKQRVLNDAFNIVVPDGFPSAASTPYWVHRVQTKMTNRLGGFRAICEDQG